MLRPAPARLVPARLAPVLLALALAALPAAARADLPQRSVSVTGTGEATAVPDIAIVSLGVTSLAPTATGALSANSDAMARIFALLRAEGVEDRDMQTGPFSLNPVWQHDDDGEVPPRITGYQVVNMLTLRVRQLDSLGALLDGLSREGANQIDSIAFDVSDPAAALAEARRAAVADARARAELYATAAGAKLGRVLTITEQGMAMPMPDVAFRAAAIGAAPVPVARGESRIGAAVSVTYALD
jgi:hypothetical protein